MTHFIIEKRQVCVTCHNCIVMWLLWQSYTPCPRKKRPPFIFWITLSKIPSNALTLLVGRQEEHPACKNWAVGCRRGYLSGARCRLADSWCHCHSLSLASVKSRSVLPFWYRLTRVIPEKWPLNGCVYVCVSVKNLPILMIFGKLNPDKIWHENLTGFSTSPVKCSYFTLGNTKKVIFNSIIHTYLLFFMLSQKKKYTPLVHPPENVTTLACKLKTFNLT